MGPDPFGCVDGALLERWVDVATGELLRDEAELAERFAGPAADAHLEALEVAGLLDLLVEPATHLAAGVAGKETLGIKLGAELVDQLLAIAMVVPCILLTRIEAEWNCAEQGPIGSLPM